MRRIGVLMAYADTDLEAKKWIAAFNRRIAELGWKAGSNVTIEYRWAGDAHVARSRSSGAGCGQEQIGTRLRDHQWRTRVADQGEPCRFCRAMRPRVTL